MKIVLVQKRVFFISLLFLNQKTCSDICLGQNAVVYKFLQSILIYNFFTNGGEIGEESKHIFVDNPRAIFHKILSNQWTKINVFQWVMFEIHGSIKALNWCWKRIIYLRVIRFKSFGLYKFWYVTPNKTRNKSPQTILNFIHEI